MRILKLDEFFEKLNINPIDLDSVPDIGSKQQFKFEPYDFVLMNNGLFYIYLTADIINKNKKISSNFKLTGTIPNVNVFVRYSEERSKFKWLLETFLEFDKMVETVWRLPDVIGIRSVTKNLITKHLEEDPNKFLAYSNLELFKGNTTDIVYTKKGR